MTEQKENTAGRNNKYISPAQRPNVASKKSAPPRERPSQTDDDFERMQGDPENPYESNNHWDKMFDKPNSDY